MVTRFVARCGETAVGRAVRRLSLSPSPRRPRPSPPPPCPRRTTPRPPSSSFQRLRSTLGLRSPAAVARVKHADPPKATKDSTRQLGLMRRVTTFRGRANTPRAGGGLLWLCPPLPSPSMRQGSMSSPTLAEGSAHRTRPAVPLALAPPLAPTTIAPAPDRRLPIPPRHRRPRPAHPRAHASPPRPPPRISPRTDTAPRRPTPTPTRPSRRRPRPPPPRAAARPHAAPPLGTPPVRTPITPRSPSSTRQPVGSTGTSSPRASPVAQPVRRALTSASASHLPLAPRSAESPPIQRRHACPRRTPTTAVRLPFDTHAACACPHIRPCDAHAQPLRHPPQSLRHPSLPPPPSTTAPPSPTVPHAQAQVPARRPRPCVRAPRRSAPTRRTAISAYPAVRSCRVRCLPLRRRRWRRGIAACSLRGRFLYLASEGRR